MEDVRRTTVPWTVSRGAGIPNAENPSGSTSVIWEVVEPKKGVDVRTEEPQSCDTGEKGIARLRAFLTRFTLRFQLIVIFSDTESKKTFDAKKKTPFTTAYIEINLRSEGLLEYKSLAKPSSELG